MFKWGMWAMIHLNKFLITPTIFPDKTSQVWKIPESYIIKYNKIVWKFEGDKEIMILAQLVDLIRSKGESHIHLSIPFFPYARQDKEVSNTATFALHTFCKLIDTMGIDVIETYDIHSNIAREILKTPLLNESPLKRINEIIDYTDPEVLIFPDEGAKKRYGGFSKHHSAYFTKVRNQQTGEITGLSTDNDKALVKWGSFLIIDDLCDGGATFTNIANYILEKNPRAMIGLYTSHGLYTKGIHTLFDSGIVMIANRNDIILIGDNNEN